MQDSPVVRVQIFGSEYQISSDVDPEHTREVARYIDRRMREVAHSLSLRSVAKIAVLTAVNLTDELLRAQAENEQMSQQADEKADLLANSVNRLTWNE